jgi:hypothetical protein
MYLTQQLCYRSQLLAILSTVVTICTTEFDAKELRILYTVCVYVFFMILRINNYYFLKQY